MFFLSPPSPDGSTSGGVQIHKQGRARVQEAPGLLAGLQRTRDFLSGRILFKYSSLVTRANKQKQVRGPDASKVAGPAEREPPEDWGARR